jgi:uncharacterized membrane protein
VSVWFHTLWKQLEISRWELAFMGVVAAAATAFAGISFARYWAFDSRTWDLGYYTQIYLGVARGAYPPLLPHISPIVYLFVPVLLAFPAPSTLLVIQAAAVAGSGFPLYWLTRESTHREDVAFIVGTAYLAGFLPLSLTWFDFHIETLLPLFFLATLYARRRSHTPGFVAGLGFALGATEASVPLILVLSVSLFLSARFSRTSSPDVRRRDGRLSMMAAAIAGAWIVVLLVLFVLVPDSALTLSELLGPVSHNAVPGPLGLNSLPILFAGTFGALLQNLLTDLPAKVVYLLLLLGAFGFLSVLGDAVEVAPGLLWIVFVFASYDPSIFAFGNQFASYGIPFVAAAATSALGRIYSGAPVLLTRWRRLVSGRSLRRLRGSSGSIALSVLLVGLLLTSAVGDPLRPSPLAADPQGTFGPPTLTSHEALLHDVIAGLPPRAVIVTTNNLFPEVSADPNARSFLNSPALMRNSSLEAADQSLLQGAQYVLLDYTQDWTNAAAVALMLNLSGFDVVEAGQGIRLYERSQDAGPISWIAPERTYFSPGDFIPSEATFNSSSGGSLSYSPRPTTLPPWLWFGPNFYNIAPGHYSFTATVSAVSTNRSAGFALEVVFVPEVLVETVVQLAPHLWQTRFFVTVDQAEQQTLCWLRVPATSSAQLQFPVLPFNWTGPGELALIGEQPTPNVAVNFYGATLQNVQDPL